MKHAAENRAFTYLVQTGFNGKRPYPPSAAGRNVLRTGLSRVRAGLKRERVSLGWLLGVAAGAIPPYAPRRDNPDRLRVGTDGPRSRAIRLTQFATPSRQGPTALFKISA